MPNYDLRKLLAKTRKAKERNPPQNARLLRSLKGDKPFEEVKKLGLELRRLEQEYQN
jgi:hypothetical protein